MPALRFGTNDRSRPYRLPSGNVDDRANSTAPYYIDVDGDSRVELITHARAAALENLPETDSCELTDAEAAVLREHQRRHRDLLERSRGELSDLAGELDRLYEQLPCPRDLEAAAREREAAIEKELAGECELIPLRQKLQGRRRDLRSFVRENQAREPARYPSSVLLHLGVVAALVVIESVMNAGFFAAASTFGLVGGFLVATGISAANVGVGLVAGYFGRWRNHRKAHLRRLAMAGLVAFVVVAILFNLGVAHLREQSVSGTADATPIAAMFRDPLAISFPSAVLFLIGLLAALIAARKGFTLDSKIPGHGEADRALRLAERLAAEHERKVRDAVLAHADGVPVRCREIVGRAEDILRQLGELVVKALRVLEAYEAERERLERWCHLWLKRYRSENEAIRSTPNPAYFAVFPPFPSELDPAPVRQMDRRLGSAREGLASLRSTADRISANQPSRVAAARDRFERHRREALRRADAGRGDGSVLDGAPPDAKELAS